MFVFETFDIDKIKFLWYNLTNNVKGGINIKQGTQEYKEYIKHRNAKNLRRRTKNKKSKKSTYTYQYEYNRKSKKIANYNKKSRHYRFTAPETFSFLNNTAETLEFFKDLNSFILDERNTKKRLFIDLSKINYLTHDALMYLLAIVNSLKDTFKNKFQFSGNSPSNPDSKKLFDESGFYRFVKHIGNTDINRNSNNIQIRSGNNSDTNFAKSISDFVSKNANIDIKDCRFIYTMIIELMSNTFKHAYDDKSLFVPCWYCFARFSELENIISFTFMDTGAGIPATVKKNFLEKIKFLNIRKENQLVRSALDGEFRTGTELPYRGKGLPKIKEFCDNNKIQNTRIITNKADVTIKQNGYDSTDLTIPLVGTLYYWEIDINELKGKCNNVIN